MLLRSVLPIVLLGASLTGQTPHSVKSLVPPPAEPDLKTAAPPVAKTGGARDAAVMPPPATADRPDPIEARLAATLVRGLRQSGVLIDRPDPAGAIWALGASYKATFASNGTSFMPYLGAERESTPVRFALRRITVGEHDLALQAMPTRVGHRIESHHDECVETFELADDAIEQTFRFDRLEQRGAIVVTIDVATTLPVTDRGDGITFETPIGPITYSEAVALDALGRRVVAPTTYADGRITIVVPADFVAAAALPLVIDPLIGSPQTWSHGGYELTNPDIAWNEAAQRFAVSFERTWSPTDHDCFVQLLDADMNLAGATIVVDGTSDVWTEPHIANNRVAGRFLVVAQVSVDGVSPLWVGGRLLDAAGSIATPPFDIARAGVAGHATGDKLHPDVGGDPVDVGPTFFAVVWERAYASLDHDIHMKLVRGDGTLVSPSPIYIDNSSSTFDIHPTISKSNGGIDDDAQTWGIAWERRYSSTDYDIYGAFAMWNGQLRQINGATTIALDVDNADDRAPHFSEPNQVPGPNQLLLVYNRQNGLGNLGDIRGMVYQSDGTLVAVANLSSLENDPQRPFWNQTRPAVATDGTRFAVTYQENAANTPNLDTRVSLFACLPNGTLVVHEAGVLVGGSSLTEQKPAICSRYGGSSLPMRGFGIACDLDGATSWSILANRYDGYATGGITQRTTGCGGLGISVNGDAVLGSSLSIAVNAPVSGTGLLFGLPASIGIPQCPGCTIGVNGDSLPTKSLSINVPRLPALVGVTVAFQGFRLSGGSCFGQVALTDTIDVTVR